MLKIKDTHRLQPPPPANWGESLMTLGSVCFKFRLMHSLKPETWFCIRGTGSGGFVLIIAICIWQMGEALWEVKALNKQ